MAMAAAEDAPPVPPMPLPAMPLPAMPLPAPNPDAQTTVNDFLDYTEFFPSDLVRSLTLIGELDAKHADAVQQVHELTSLYCQLPALPEQERPDPALLRKQIAQHLQRAIDQREHAHTEAARLYEVTLRHCQRSSIIKRKLQAQPEPPSRDPTPPPVSPHAQRALARAYDRPRLHLSFDHKKSAVPLPRGRSRAHSPSSSDDDGPGPRLSLPERSRKPHTYKDRAQKPRGRAPGVAGTNVHSSIAGISTSNALAKLSPPPPDARPGSKWAPWMKLTEYEMAVLRKQMKKNAVWTPSLTMVNRELERKHRTQGDYDRERARCEAAGEDLLDEEPETLLQIATAQGVDDPALAATATAADGLTAPSEPARDESVEGFEGRRPDRNTRRQQAMRAVRALEDATKTIQNAADGLKELTFASHAVSTPPASARKRSTARPATNKRKRDATSPPPESTAEPGTAELGKESEPAQADTTQPPEPKRPRLQLIAPAPPPDPRPSTPAPASADAVVSKELTPAAPSPAAPSPAAQTPVPLPETTTSSSSVQVPLAPAGPGTPEVKKPESKKPESNETTRQATPAQPSPAESKSSSPAVPTPPPEQAPPPSNATAALSRPRRESVAQKMSSPAAPEPSRPTRSNTPAVERAPSPGPTIALRPRSARSHVPTPKAQSEEPKPKEAGRPTRDTRRHSIFSQSALTAPVPTRVSLRKKPPPKGEVTAAENGQKTVTNVKRSHGTKNGRKKKPEDPAGPVEDVDSDEERYCICDDVSYGQMVSCDNNCAKEWFHFQCVGMTVMPPRRAKWYCPDCREALGTDAFGNPKVPQRLPGRRGNRGWST